jgi:hypothetical protein|tara:strand:+ start:6749 stop:7846 length:1098 start_codon:yes stop_codon:yes gene_type:complete
MSSLVKNDFSFDFTNHLIQLRSIFQKSALMVIISSIILSFFIDDLILLWFEFINIGHNSLNLTNYSPSDWLSIRFSLVLILACIVVLPFFSIMLRKFTIIGMTSKENLWFTLTLFFSTTLTPLIFILVWIYIIPLWIELFEIASLVESVGKRYDAVSILGIGIGISWVILIGNMVIMTLGFARLVGLVENGQAKFRIRIMLISTSILILSLPFVYDGLRVFISVITILIADRISTTVPNPILGTRIFEVSDVSFKGKISRIGVIDCSCEGSSPTIPDSWNYEGVANPKCNAICLNSFEQYAIIDLIVEKKLSQLIITGCDASPLPVWMQERIKNNRCEFSGLNWLDSSNINEDGMLKSLQFPLEE